MTPVRVKFQSECTTSCKQASPHSNPRSNPRSNPHSDYSKLQLLHPITKPSVTASTHPTAFCAIPHNHSSHPLSNACFTISLPIQPVRRLLNNGFVPRGLAGLEIAFGGDCKYGPLLRRIILHRATAPVYAYSDTALPSALAPCSPNLVIRSHPLCPAVGFVYVLDPHNSRSPHLRIRAVFPTHIS